MELTNQASQALDLSVHVSDERSGAPMPEVVHLLMPKDHEEVAEIRWARSNILQVFDITAIGAKISQESKPICSHSSVWICSHDTGHMWEASSPHLGKSFKAWKISH
jgi:hypothetical protein